MTSAPWSHHEVRPHRTPAVRPMKPGRVPTTRIAPILETLIKDRWPYSDEDADSSGIPTGQAVLSGKVGCDTTTIAKIIAQENAGVDFDLADRLFCALGRPDVWRGELLDLYEGMTILEKCRRDGCSVSYVPRMGGPSGFQRYCSRRCRQMANLKAVGKVKDATKRNLKTSCRNGHKRTPENTANDGACRICDRAAQKRKRERMTPEQRAVVRAYNRAYHQKRKAVGA